MSKNKKSKSLKSLTQRVDEHIQKIEQAPPLHKEYAAKEADEYLKQALELIPDLKYHEQPQARKELEDLNDRLDKMKLKFLRK